MLKRIFRKFAVNVFTPISPEQMRRVESKYKEDDLDVFLDRFLAQKNGRYFIMVRHG